MAASNVWLKSGSAQPRHPTGRLAPPVSGIAVGLLGKTMPNETPLTAAALSRILLKLFGLYWIISSVLMIPNVIALRVGVMDSSIPRPPGMDIVYRSQLLLAVLVFGIGATLFLAPPRLAGYLSLSHIGADEPLSSSTAQSVGFSLLGVWLLVSSLPSLAASAVVLLALSKHGRGLERSNYIDGNWQSLLLYGFEAALGLWLFGGARGLSAAWHRLRSGKQSTEGR